MEALLIIDMTKGNMKNIYNREEIVENQLQLIKKFKDTKQPIIIVTSFLKRTTNPVMLRLWGDEFANQLHMKDLLPELKIKPSLLVRKTGYSAFYKTKLETYCKKHKITTLYCCGVYSGVCVFFTAADAADRGIQPILVTDASTTETKKWHEENCKRFRQVLGPLVTTKQLLENTASH